MAVISKKIKLEFLQLWAEKLSIEDALREMKLSVRQAINLRLWIFDKASASEIAQGLDANTRAWENLNKGMVIRQLVDILKTNPPVRVRLSVLRLLLEHTEETADRPDESAKIFLDQNLTWD